MKVCVCVCTPFPFESGPLDKRPKDLIERRIDSADTQTHRLGSNGLLVLLRWAKRADVRKGGGRGIKRNLVKLSAVSSARRSWSAEYAGDGGGWRGVGGTIDHVFEFHNWG